MRLRPAHATDGTAARPRGGYVIFAVLVVIVVLSLVAYRFTDSMTAEQRAAVRAHDEAQAKAAAYSGLHYAAAVLSDPQTFAELVEGEPYDNPDIFERFEVQVASSGQQTGSRRAYFSIQTAALADGGYFEQRFGVIDEAGKVNINAMIAFDPKGQLLHDVLMKIPILSDKPDVVDSIVDWVDGDDEARVEGAETAYYQSLPNPYKAKNGPLNTLDEMLLIKGVTPELLYGYDKNRNGVKDDGETDALPGLAAYVTVYGRELNVASDGTARVFINGDDPQDVYTKLQGAVGNDLATYIVAAKYLSPQPVPSLTAAAVGSDGSISFSFTGAQPQPGTQQASTDQLYNAMQARITATGSGGKRVRSIFGLIGTQITLPRDPSAAPDAPTLVAYCPLNDQAKFNEMLPAILDRTTVRQAIEMVPRINVNTAPREVLMSIVSQKGESILTDTEADAIVTNRANQLPTDVATTSLAWLITTNTIPLAKYAALEKYITGTTMIYRVQSVGYLEGGGPVARVEAVLDIGALDPTTGRRAPRFLFVRDLIDLENPRGFQPSTTAAPGAGAPASP